MQFCALILKKTVKITETIRKTIKNIKKYVKNIFTQNFIENPKIIVKITVTIKKAAKNVKNVKNVFLEFCRESKNKGYSAILLLNHS